MESSADSKEKDPLLGKDLGKDFLSSWKSMSLTEDDTMAFNFDPVPNGKKKTFNFEKMDMDFNLDGDFDKLSSFKVDMPDLDFSCSTKTTAKPVEKSQEESIGSFRKKKDQFSFSFDFELDTFDLDSRLMKKRGVPSNENVGSKEVASDKEKERRSDSFNLDSSLMKNRGNTSRESLDSKLVASDRNEHQSPEVDEGRVNDDSIIAKLSASESMANSKVETELQGPGICIHKKDTVHVAPQALCSPPKKMLSPILEETDKQSCSTEDTTSLGLQPFETAHAHLVDGSGLNLETDTDIHKEICTSGTKVFLDSGADESFNDKVIPTVGSNHGNMGQKGSSVLYTAIQEKSSEQKELSPNSLKEMTDETRTTKCDSDIENTSTAVLSGKGQPDICSNQNFWMQNSNSKLPLAPSCSKKPIDDSKTMDETDVGPIQSMFLKKPEQTGSHILQRSPSRLEVLPFCRESISSTSSSGNAKWENDAKLGCKSVGYSKSLPVILPKARQNLLDSEKNVTSLRNNRGGLNVNAVDTRAKLVGGLKLQDKHATKEKSLMLKSEKDTASQANASSPTEKTCTLLASSMEPLQKSKISSLERLKVGKSTPDLLTMKTLRTIEADKEAPNSTYQQGGSSLMNLNQNVEPTGKESSENLHSVVRAEKLMPQTPSLKRKIFEVSKASLASLKPPKRLSTAPSETRNLRESLEKDVEEKVLRQEDKANYGSPNAGSEAFKEVNMTELEMPLVMENDDNVEKAEAYTKELENICNMLRKKHEEAKELLVRAIVNNNNLLMLNHPLYEQKKFAEKLMMSRKNPMPSATVV